MSEYNEEYNEEYEVQPKKRGGYRKNAGRKKQEVLDHTVQVRGIKITGKSSTVINPDDVYKLAALGCSQTDIANYFGINLDTLRYNFMDELISGKEDMKISLRRAMLNNACDKLNPAVQIFLAKNFLGMRDTPIDTEDTKPLPWNDDFD